MGKSRYMRTYYMIIHIEIRMIIIFQIVPIVLLLFFHNSNGQLNSLYVKFWWKKIEANLRRANTEPSMNFRSTNTET